MPTSYTVDPSSTNYKLLSLKVDETDALKTAMENVSLSHFKSTATGSSALEVTKLLNIDKFLAAVTPDLRDRILEELAKGEEGVTEEWRNFIDAILYSSKGGTKSTIRDLVKKAMGEDVSVTITDNFPAQFTVSIDMSTIDPTTRITSTEDLKSLISIIKASGVAFIMNAWDVYRVTFPSRTTLVTDKIGTTSFYSNRFRCNINKVGDPLTGWYITTQVTYILNP